MPRRRRGPRWHTALANWGLTAIWAGYYEGNERSHRVQEKLGFEFQYRRESDVELLGEHRIEICQRLVPQR